MSKTPQFRWASLKCIIRVIWCLIIGHKTDWIEYDMKYKLVWGDDGRLPSLTCGTNRKYTCKRCNSIVRWKE